MKQLECMVAWTPAHIADDDPYISTRGKVEVVPWPDAERGRRRYSRSVGACFFELHKMPEWQRIAMLFIDFHTLTVRDGIDPQVAHKAFLAIDEYRARISPDIPGADE